MTELIGPLADVEIVGGFTIVFEAVDPDTGAAVTGVAVSDIGIYADDGSDILTTVAPQTDVAPAWVPLPVETPEAAPAASG